MKSAGMCWRRSAVVKGVAVMVVVQVFVAVCVLSLLQQQQEQQQKWKVQQEAPEKVGDYVILLRVPTKASIEVPQNRTKTPPNLELQVSGPSTPSTTLLRGYGDKDEPTAKNREQGHEGGGDERVYKYRRDGMGKESGGQAGAKKGERKVEKYGEEDPLLGYEGQSKEEIIKYRDLEQNGEHGGHALEADREEKKQEKEEEEEEEEVDPNKGRGFVDEFVTYRSEGDSFLLVDDEHRKSTTANTTTPRHQIDSGTKNQKEPSLGSDVREENEEGETEDYKFKSYDPQNPFKLTLKDDQKEYFRDINGAACFIAGTDIEETSRGSGGDCHCLEGYFGVDCGIPEAAWFETYRNKYPNTQLRRRAVPRRVINGVTVNHEFAMFEARMHELYEVVDVFIIAESNYTAHGDPKEFLFQERLRSGYMQEFQDKILYVSLDTFPAISQTSGWIADSYLRFHLSNKGLPLVKDLRDDDLFVLSDADELPKREVITFLKVYDGYPEPVSFGYQWNVFGFFWKVPAKDTWSNWLKGNNERVCEVSSVSTIGMLRKVLFNNAFYIRKTGLWQYYKLYKKLKSYREEGHMVKEWVLGTTGHYAGWHCSWCSSPKDMVVKMNSAQADDKPRWGSMPEKKNLSYIASRVRQGMWFDDKERYLAARNPKAKNYAPRYLLDHPERYRSLIYHPDHPLNHGQPWAPP